MSRVPEELVVKGQYWTKPWNPIRVKGGGFHCTKISPGCKNCWAESMNLRGGGKPYDNKEYEYEIAPGASNIVKMKNEVVAVQWMGDLFHQDIPDLYIQEVWRMLHSYDSNTYLVLTKRIERFLALAKKYCWAGFDHVFIGVSVESPEYLYRLEKLMEWPGKKFLALAPYLAGIDFIVGGMSQTLMDLECVIIECESGVKRRTGASDFELERTLVDCESRVPIFLKQWEIDGVLTKMPRFLSGTRSKLAW